MSGYRGSGHPGEPVDRNPGAARRIPADEHGEPLRLRAVGWGYEVAWELARRLPEPLALSAATAGAGAAQRWATGMCQQLRANLARVVAEPDLDTAVAAGLRSYARYWAEAFRAGDMSAQALDRRTTTTGFGYLDRVLDRGQGAIVLLAHHGSWDLAARWAETHGYHLAVVAEVLRPRRVFHKFVRLREQMGVEVVPLRRGADLTRRLEQVLAANHFVGLLSERDLSGRGPVVPLFGEDVRLPPGPVVLSRRTGTPIVPATMLQRPGRRWHIEVLPPIDVSQQSLRQGVARVARGLEDLIRLDPSQWHATQPIWLADRAPRHRSDCEPPSADDPGDGRGRGPAGRVRSVGRP